MIWDIIQKKIEDAGLAVGGETLFLQNFPGDVSVGIGMFEPLEGVHIDPYMPGLHKPDLKIIVRHSNVADGAALARQVMNLLTITAEEAYAATADRGAVMLKVFYPRSLPIQFPALSGNGIEWALVFQTAFTIQSA
jgi:hypothetical protein